MSTKVPRRRDADGFWAITTYFNPMRYRRKHANYQRFRERLGVPLVAVELAHGPDFELGVDDAEILVKLRGHDVLWQKERLLNVALEALPISCDKVTWLDCDVIFESDDWLDCTRRLLERVSLVQPFSHVHRMPPDWGPGQAPSPDAEVLRSVPFLIASGMPVATCLGTPASQIQCTPGHAWAANRALLDEHGVYDACIVGGADTAIARAAYGRFDDALRLQPLHAEHYLAWAKPFHAAVRSNVAYVEGKLFHLWHGKTEHRRYRERNESLRRFAFNPFTDVVRDRQGVWQWNSEKPEMHEFVRDYFSSRREDG
jgi:hypothetical protein